MAWFKTIIGKNGEINTYSWSINHSIGVSVTTFGLYLLIVILTNMVASAFCLFIYSFSIRNHRRTQGIFGIISVILLLIDYQYGILGWHFFNKFPETYDMLMTINVIFLMIHVIALIFDEVIFNMFHSTRMPLIMSLTFYTVITYYAYPVVNKMFNYLFTISETPFFT